MARKSLDQPEHRMYWNTEGDISNAPHLSKINQNIGCIETDRAWRYCKRRWDQPEHRMYWNQARAFYAALWGADQPEHRMYWNPMAKPQALWIINVINQNIGCIETWNFPSNHPINSKINQNIGCIETEIGMTNPFYMELINQNIGCIETHF